MTGEESATNPGPESASLVLVGNPDPVHVGAHLGQAARDLNLDLEFADTNRAFDGPAWQRTLSWRLRGHRPLRLREFSREIVALCSTHRPRWLLSTGLAPLEASALAAIGALGIRRLNFLTDDPWNPAHYARWFVEALPLYDRVFSPRRTNLNDLRALGCRKVTYLPFAYAPELHFPEPPSESERKAFESEVAFVGGADRDRVPYLTALVQAGFDVALYGGYWERFAATRSLCRGFADPPTVRKAIGGAKVALCLVRRANRDGHAMRTFEVAAIGACMLVEDTDEHRQLFGPDGEAAVYFASIDQMLVRLRWLLEHEAERCRLAQASRRLIVGGEHTYRDRLVAMLDPPGGLA